MRTFKILFVTQILFFCVCYSYGQLGKLMRLGAKYALTENIKLAIKSDIKDLFNKDDYFHVADQESFKDVISKSSIFENDLQKLNKELEKADNKTANNQNFLRVKDSLTIDNVKDNCSYLEKKSRVYLKNDLIGNFSSFSKNAH